AIDYRACGAFELASGEVEWSKLTARALVQAAAGIPSRFAGEGELAALGLERYRGALFYPEDAIVDPRDVMSALRLALGRHGVALRELTRVQQIDPVKGEVVLTEGRLSAGTVVLAAGAWSSQLLSGVVESFPVKGHLLGYNLAAGSLLPIIRHQHTYILQRSSGFTVAGSTTEHAGFDREVKASTVATVHERARRCLPGLLPDAPATAWIGFRPGAASDNPLVGRLDETRVWLAYGHYRNGILLAPATARAVAREIISSSGTG
ncbi:MAG: NAD(P)/FAD-dependent oxidoreductase, partial [Bryobacteraceae bacterium]